MRFVLLFSLLFYSTSFIGQPIKLGLITDCQYCNCESSLEWNNYYKNSPLRLQESVDTLNKNDLNAVFHLGDFIDREFTSYAEITPIWDKLIFPKFHLLGNHDFSVAPELKKEVPSILNLTKTYYFEDYKNWRVIVLDGTDISLYKSSDSLVILNADSIRKSYLKMGREQSLPWNGAIGADQMQWIDSLLTQCDLEEKNVLLLCHFPVFPKSDANLWNDEEIVALLEQHSSVKAFINGHHHPGNYALKNGIHYLTLQGMVYSEKENAFSIGILDSSKISIQGFGREPSRNLSF